MCNKRKCPVAYVRVGWALRASMGCRHFLRCPRRGAGRLPAREGPPCCLPASWQCAFAVVGHAGPLLGESTGPTSRSDCNRPGHVLSGCRGRFAANQGTETRAKRPQIGLCQHPGRATRSVPRPGSYENAVVSTTRLITTSVKKSFLRPEKNGYLVLYGIWRKNTDQIIDFYAGDFHGFPPGPGPILFLHQGPAQNRRARGGSGNPAPAAPRAVRPRRSAQGGRPSGSVG
ncbi:hypothetical protein ACIDI_228c00030 [Acidiphilium sp. JA12-A1]|nr:hypothetical protein ACIDI_228c00030 [Acidiphilium sp. JA12-A1]